MEQVLRLPLKHTQVLNGELRAAHQQVIEQFRILLDAAPDALVLVDNEGDIVQVNARAESLFGYANNELVGQTVETLLPERFRSLHIEQRTGFVREQRIRPMGEQLEVYALHKDGQEIPVEICLSPLQVEEAPFVLSSIRDITPWHRINEEVRLQSASIQAVTDGCLIVDARAEDHPLVFINDSFTRITGYTEEEALGEHCCFIQGPKTDPETMGRLQEAMREQVLFEGEMLCYKKEGTPFWNAFRIAPVRNDEGEVTHFVGSINDVTLRKEAYEEIERLNAKLASENVYLRKTIDLRHPHHDIVGESPTLRTVLALVEKVAETDATVLITGETGTGKELIAEAIHRLSPRNKRTMIKINCAALPASLIESELFGREKGAYTGAMTRQAGLFEVADGSTLFLDEIGELPPELQVKLLRVLEGGRFHRLGSAEEVTVDVRVVVATNRDLEQAVEDGRFRQDLFYRLNMFPVQVPPLRTHAEDIPALVWTFAKAYADRFGRKLEGISKPNMAALKRYAWPGNVRELRNVVERAVILMQGTTLQIDVPSPARKNAHQKTLKEIERVYIEEVLAKTEGQVFGDEGAAKILGLNPHTLYSRMKKLEIEGIRQD